MQDLKGGCRGYGFGACSWWLLGAVVGANACADPCLDDGLGQKDRGNCEVGVATAVSASAGTDPSDETRGPTSGTDAATATGTDASGSAGMTTGTATGTASGPDTGSDTGGETMRYCRDADGDLQGDPTDCREADAPPEGYVPNGDDCDDGDQALAARCPVDLSMCSVTNIEGIPATPANPDPGWDFDTEGTSGCQRENSRPTVLLCDPARENFRFSGHFIVDTAQDDDQVGLVWGWQDARHFYLLTWKQLSQTIDVCDAVATPAGIMVKRIHANADLSCADLLGVDDTPSQTVLTGVSAAFDQGWADRATYILELEHEAARSTVTVRLESDGSELASFVVDDDTYPSGRYGMYLYSQEDTCWSNFTIEPL